MNRHRPPSPRVRRLACSGFRHNFHASTSHTRLYTRRPAAPSQFPIPNFSGPIPADLSQTANNIAPTIKTPIRPTFRPPQDHQARIYRAPWLLLARRMQVWSHSDRLRQRCPRRSQEILRLPRSGAQNRVRCRDGREASMQTRSQMNNDPTHRSDQPLLPYAPMVRSMRRLAAKHRAERAKQSEEPCHSH